MKRKCNSSESCGVKKMRVDFCGQPAYGLLKRRLIWVNKREDRHQELARGLAAQVGQSKAAQSKALRLFAEHCLGNPTLWQSKKLNTHTLIGAYLDGHAPMSIASILQRSAPPKVTNRIASSSKQAWRSNTGNR